MFSTVLTSSSKNQAVSELVGACIFLKSQADRIGMLSPVVNDIDCEGLMRLSLRPHWARATLVKSLFLLDNWPSFVFFFSFCLKSHMSPSHTLV